MKRTIGSRVFTQGTYSGVILKRVSFRNENETIWGWLIKEDAPPHNISIYSSQGLSGDLDYIACGNESMTEKEIKDAIKRIGL